MGKRPWLQMNSPLKENSKEWPKILNEITENIVGGKKQQSVDEEKEGKVKIKII